MFHVCKSFLVFAATFFTEGGVGEGKEGFEEINTFLDCTSTVEPTVCVEPNKKCVTRVSG